MTDETLTTIEINGVKMEVDLRHARRIDELRMGDRVKVLKKGYGDSYSVHHGIIIGFEPFEKLPTIIIAYMTSDYSSATLNFCNFNAKTQDIEVVKAVDDDDLELDRQHIRDVMMKQINTKRQEAIDIEQKLAYFEKRFATYWENVTLPQGEVEAD